MEPEKHEVISNEVADSRNYDYKTFLWRAKNDFGLKSMTTYSYPHGWFGDSLLEADATDLSIFQTEEESTVMLESELANNDWDVTFF